jgi:hypothetical protein
MPTKHKDSFTAGLEHILNDPQTSFLKNPAVFREIHKASGMPLVQMISHIGKKARGAKPPSGPTMDERREARLARLQGDEN